MDKEEQFASRKSSRSQVFFLDTRQNKKYMWGPRQEQDVYQSHGTPHPNRGIYKISGGMTSFHSCGIGFRRRGIGQQFGVM